MKVNELKPVGNFNHVEIVIGPTDLISIRSENDDGLTCRLVNGRLVAWDVDGQQWQSPPEIGEEEWLVGMA